MKPFLKDDTFKQDITYNNDFIPYQLTPIQVENGHPDILFHWHPEMEVHYVYKGTARYHIDYDYFNSQPGDIILMRPNAMHSVHPINNHPHHVDSFLCHLDMVASSSLDKTSISHIQPLQTNQSKFTPVLRPGDPGYEPIKNCLMTIIETIRSTSRHKELLIKSQVTYLIYLLYFHKHVRRKQSDDAYRKNEKIRELIDYIQEHYQDNLNLDHLAQLMGYSKPHFMAVFKQHTGVSCTEFIIHFRLHKAKEALIQSNKPILDIANQCGFNNLSNFNRQFKAYYQQTPSQYRKAFLKKHPKKPDNPRKTRVNS